jgi:hypothetical protein
MEFVGGAEDTSARSASLKHRVQIIHELESKYGAGAVDRHFVELYEATVLGRPFTPSAVALYGITGQAHDRIVRELVSSGKVPPATWIRIKGNGPEITRVVTKHVSDAPVFVTCNDIDERRCHGPKPPGLEEALEDLETYYSDLVGKATRTKIRRCCSESEVPAKMSSASDGCRLTLDQTLGSFEFGGTRSGSFQVKKGHSIN